MHIFISDGLNLNFIEFAKLIETFKSCCLFIFFHQTFRQPKWSFIQSKQKNSINILFEFECCELSLDFVVFFISSEIYCRGDLLHTVQMAKLYNDSKTFVDMKMKRPPQHILDSFRDFMAENDNKPEKDKIRQFVNVSFTFQLFKSWLESRNQ